MIFELFISYYDEMTRSYGVIVELLPTNILVRNKNFKIDANDIISLVLTFTSFKLFCLY